MTYAFSNYLVYIFFCGKKEKRELLDIGKA